MLQTWNSLLASEVPKKASSSLTTRSFKSAPRLVAANWLIEERLAISKIAKLLLPETAHKYIKFPIGYADLPSSLEPLLKAPDWEILAGLVTSKTNNLLESWLVAR